MKNVIIIHACPDNTEKTLSEKTRTYDKHWMPWTKEQLSSKDIDVKTPLIQTPWNPKYENFKNELEKLKVTPDTILIGHSCSCAFLVRWLGETKQIIAKLILVAPWNIPEQKSEEAFYTYPIDETIKDRINEIVMFTADNEEPEGKESLTIFHQALGGKIIDLPGHGHYTQDDMGTTEFPELLEEII